MQWLFDYLLKLKRGLGLAFGACFLHDFFLKKVLKGTGFRQKNKVNFLRLFDNPLSKYLI